MDLDDDDDFYSPEEAVPETKTESGETPAAVEIKGETVADKDLEEGEEEEGEEVDAGGDDEEEEDDDSDIDIITERKDDSKPAPPSAPPKYNSISIAPNKPSTPTKPSTPQIKKETSPRTATAPSGGGDLPAISTSKLDVNAKPIYPPANKAITALDIDADLPENDKPWRRPGADVSDYFNYGFDEFTWALYATKQESLRSEFSADKVAQSNKKMMEEMSSMMMMGGMPMGGMPGMTAPDGTAMTPEMMAMMQQMMGAGMDPSQMSEQMFAGMQAGAGGQSGYGGQGFGYDQGTINAGSGGRGNFGGGGGRGRRGGRGW